MALPRAGTQRFTGVVRAASTGAHVEVPAAVSRAFASQVRSGRIAVEGRIKGTSLTATLMPVRGGGHYLPVNAGLRATAGLEVGDRVRIELRATALDSLGPSPDLAAALEKRSGAARAFR